MKNKLLLALTVFCLTSAVAYSQEKQENLKLKGIVMKNDYHRKTTWIKSKPIPLVTKDFIVSAYEVTYIQLYFGMYIEDSVQKVTPIHIVNCYNSSNWVFFDEISYLLGSRKEVREHRGTTFKLYDKDTKKEVDRGVEEYSDITINKDVKSFIKYIIEQPVTRLEVRYANYTDGKVYDLQVNGGTKLLKKHFTTFITAYNQVNKFYSLNNTF